MGYSFLTFHLIVSDGVISRISVLLPTPSVLFSLDHYASDYDSDCDSVTSPALNCLGWRVYEPVLEVFGQIARKYMGKLENN